MSAVNRWLQAVGVGEQAKNVTDKNGGRKETSRDRSRSTASANTNAKSPSFPHRHRAQSTADASPTYFRRASTSVIEGVTYTPMRSIIAKEVDIAIDKGIPGTPPLTRREKEKQKFRRVRSVEAAAFRVNYVTSKHIAQACHNLSSQFAGKLLSTQLKKELEVEEDERGALFFTLSALVTCMLPSEYCPLLVELTQVSINNDPIPGLAHGGFLALVINKAQRDQSAIFVLQANMARERAMKLLLVLPIWTAVHLSLSGDGTLEVSVEGVRYEFHMPSVRSLWSTMSALHKAKEKACKHNYYPNGPSHRWLEMYDTYLVEGDTQYVPEESFSTDDFRAVSPMRSLSSPEIMVPLIEVDEAVDQTSLVVPPAPAGAEAAPPPPSGIPTEKEIIHELRAIMARSDLDNLTCGDVRAELEHTFNQDLSMYKKFIDEKMMVILGQMEQSSEIFEKFLYLGTEWNASNREELDNRQIGFVLNMAIEIDVFFPDQYQYLHVQVWDEPDVDILPYLDEAVAFIDEARTSVSRVLVHCKGWSLEEAYAYVKKRRSVIKPNSGVSHQPPTNSGFWEQLKQYEARCAAERAGAQTVPVMGGDGP